MKILSPLSKPDEVTPLVEAGAEEFYAGVLDTAWRKKYTNVGSINRREWSVSNLESYDDLDRVVRTAHKLGAKVYPPMNALYSAHQYESLNRNLEEMRKIPVDALIVADPGLLLTLKETGWDREIHISTGCTTFNHRTALFYSEFGATRIVIPRHQNITEMVRLAKSIDFMEKECFIFNSGCKNIDGFCTYHHGANEILHKGSYKLPKKLGLDYAFLKTLRRLPQCMAKKIARFCNLKSDSACLLNYKVTPHILKDWTPAQAGKAKKWLESTFNIYSGLDPCGVCAIPDLVEAGLVSIKIVGRENPTYKKVMDVKFLRRMLDLWEKNDMSRTEYKQEAKKAYKEVYDAPCQEWCYYPETSFERTLSGKDR
ncbi:MAG: U32 family peptidase [Candidatus Eremiobacteraeota bacterium]|nr:U32 family peptidase [Candidatus Eremiobacteraeota bacterium]